jgi:C-terminal processing protease CtpA/Prc
MTRLIAAAFTLLCACCALGQPTNLSLEGNLGEALQGWFIPEMVRQAGYSASIVEDETRPDGRAVLLTGQGRGEARGFGNIMQVFDAEPYRGKVVRYAADVRVTSSSRAQLWLRVDRHDPEQSGFFENMGDRPVTSDRWSRYEIVGRIDDDAAQINIGLLLIGGGSAWLDDITFEVLDVALRADEAPRALDDRGVHNLVALARALSCVRFFHPSDEAAAADYEKLAIRAGPLVEAAQTPEDLCAVLSTLFAPVAPTVRFIIAEQAPGTDFAPPQEQDVDGIMHWQHFGFGLGGGPRQVYSSRRIKRSTDDERVHSLPRVLAKELAPGIWCILPTIVYTNDSRTVPAAARGPWWGTEWEPGWRPRATDRSVRLAAVMLAWGILQHFYPYFDVIETDWDEALHTSLRAAALDADEMAFTRTLERLIAKLHDGHGMVVGPGQHNAYAFPLVLDIIEDRLVVTHSAPADVPGPQRGDIIMSIGGRGAPDLIREHGLHISAATPGFLRWRVCQELVRGGSTPAMIEVELADGTIATCRIPRTLERAMEPRPEKISEVRPGIWYIDIERINDADFRRALPQLGEARGLVFDLRGYPGKLSTVVISHLIDEPVQSAQWHVPVVPLPDRQAMTFSLSNWAVRPAQPRLTSNAAFIVDGRAISYAETYMGIIEHYRIAAIVGETTAGTNGNVNTFTLPGGYQVAFTGMKVLKHDGSPHHGVGIAPTVPAVRTLEGVRAGRDELLEKALEVVELGRR